MSEHFLLATIFWISVALVIYPYLVYPALAVLLGWLRPRPVLRSAYVPHVSVLIPAYNEAKCIEATIRNKLLLRYPKSLIEIIVASDGSDDGTDQIVKSFAGDGVKLLRCEPRGGKALALNRAVTMARGEIIVFSDANSLFHPDAIERMVENFADSRVGYVTGSLRFVAGDPALAQSGGSAYLRFEEMLRRLETQIGSIIGTNGGVDAIRAGLYSEIPGNLITDFVLPLRVIASGSRVVFDERAVSEETPNSEVRSEFRMRVRVALRALQGLAHMRQLLNPFRFPLASFCIFSHKIIRYLAFAFMAAALAANAALALTSNAYALVLGLHLLVYLLAIAGATQLAPRLLGRLTSVPGYFLMTQVAFGLAFVKFFRGQSMATWIPRS